MIHGYSLVHDDLPCMDNDELRRGKPTTHKKFGPATAMLTGNALICRAFEILGQFAEQTKLPPEMAANIIIEIARASGMEGMVGGQVADMESEGKAVTAERLAYVHAHKTGALIRSAVRIGGFASNTSPVELAFLTSYAEKLGLLFQVTDDILDVEGKEEERGKKIGGDIALDKATYPKIHGMARAKELVHELMDGCRTDLSSFGDRASVLIAIANYVATRKA